MKHISIFVIFLLLVSFGCQSAPETKVETKTDASPTKSSPTSPKTLQTMVDVPKLANKTAADFDKVFGKPAKITAATIAAEIPGEYREYQIAGHPKGLSVRFYKDKAVRFNLLLGTPEKSSRTALLKSFGIDVKSIEPDRKSEPLSEKWKGNFNGTKFETAYAKRETAKGDFVMIHAEIAK